METTKPDWTILGPLALDWGEEDHISSDRLRETTKPDWSLLEPLPLSWEISMSTFQDICQQ